MFVVSCSAIGPNRDAVDHPWWEENKLFFFCFVLF